MDNDRKEALAVVDELLEKTEAYAVDRLKATDPCLHPMVLRLASRYRLSTGESDLFQLLFMRAASKAAAVRAILGVSSTDIQIYAATSPDLKMAWFSNVTFSVLSSVLQE